MPTQEEIDQAQLVLEEAAEEQRLLEEARIAPIRGFVNSPEFDVLYSQLDALGPFLIDSEYSAHIMALRAGMSGLRSRLHVEPEPEPEPTP